jgi:aspartate/methionine/tyrosine aminotransferase
MGSVSKYFSMTGWRLGWMLVPRRHLRGVERLTSNLTICPPAVSQIAAIAAFDDESIAECDAHVARYATNRAVLLDGKFRVEHAPVVIGHPESDERRILSVEHSNRCVR